MNNFLRARRTGLALIGGVALVLAFAIPPGVLADLVGGCDFAPTGTTPSCVPPLSGSTFAGGDGNLLTSPTTFGTTDWQSVSGLHTGVDLASGTGDNAFGQGTKEDSANVTVVSGSIPPNKSDLTRFYEASEFANNSNFLYLAWERTNVLGSANMDFEINQALTPNLGSPGPHTIIRTAGDLLVTFDFNNGGGRPVLGLLTWVTTGSTSQCFSSNSLPCWGNHLNLNGTNSEAAVNNLDAVTDPFLPASSNPLAALTFGEAAINLTAAGVFPPATCEALGSVFLKSRASASFTAEVKDFVAPVPVTISNCGRIIIRKVTNPSPDPTTTTFNYTTTGGLSPASFGLTNGTSQDYGNTVPVGSYSVTESNPGPNFVLTSLVCSASDLSHGSTATTSGATVSIVLKPADTVDCTYTNTLQQGAIKITKTSIKGPALGGATFSISSGGAPIPGSPFTTDSTTGVICVDHLLFGTYSVRETAAPAGYAIDDTTAHTVTVNANSTCGDGHEAAFAATDTPLTDISVSATSEAAGGTQSTISCSPVIGNSPQGPAGSVSVSATGLKPGTYTCTVVVDP
jgi:hypothetical protein